MLKKICTKCNIKHPATTKYFYKQVTGKNGLHASCKKCESIRGKIYQQTEQGKANSRKRMAKYRQSKHGKVACKLSRQKYNQSEKGKLVNKKNCKKYYSTINGHLQGIFAAMKHRCSNPNCPTFKYYGKRGIEVCFTSDEFVDYVVNELQVDPRGLTIDRIDNSGNYEKGNIQFVTQKENCQNRG